MSIRLRWLVPAFALAVPAWTQTELPRVHTENFRPAIRAQVVEAEQAASAHPDNPALAAALAMTLHAYQQYDIAARIYSHAHALEPRRFDWLYLLGAVQMELGEFEPARASFQAALDLDPAALPARLRLAQATASLGRWSDTAGVYRQILEQHPDIAQAWYGLGRAQAAIGDRSAAARSYAKACDLFPEYGAAHFALSQELRRSGQPEEAERHRKAYALNTTAEPPLDDPLIQHVSELNHGAQAHMQRAAEFEKRGRLADAIREEEAALDADPANLQAHVNLVALYGRTDKPEKAKMHFDAAVQLNPGRSDLWYNYGVLLFRDRENSAEAERAFRRALDINPDYAQARDNLGMIYESQGRNDDAAREFRQAVASRPDYPPARFHLGRILVNEKKYDEAVQQFRRALEPESDRTPTYLYALAATLARAGRPGEALTYYQRAREAAQARGQTQLLPGIERDMKTLAAER